MAHFYGDIKGSRGIATRCGTKNSGMRAHIRGWNHGVRVQAIHYGTQPNKPDGFAIYMTSGSNGGEEWFLGEILLDKNGKPTFNNKGSEL